MPLQFPIQANFTRGEISKKMHGRIDVDHYKAAAAIVENWTIMREGGLRKRGGFKMVKEIKDSSNKVRLLPFIFGTLSTGPQAYVLEVGNAYMRFLTNGGIITNSTLGGTPTAITQANPAVVTKNAHGFVNGDKVYITGVGGMVELNNREFTVAGAAANTFQLSGVNSTGFGAFTSGGSVRKIVELATPYLTADLPLLDYAQSADVLNICHANYQPLDITRTADDVWTSSNPEFRDGPYLEEPDQNSNNVTPSITNAINPKMTSDTAPSGTAYNGPGGGGSGYLTNAYYAFNYDAILRWAMGNGGVSTGYFGYDLPGSATAVVENYVLQGPVGPNTTAPGAWRLQGDDGSGFQTIDERFNQINWGNAEKRYFEFANSQAFLDYRFNVDANNGSFANTGVNLEIAEIWFGYNGDYAPTMTLTFDTTANINDGAGFSSPDDVGRTIRLRGSDSKWRWFRITGVSSTKIVTGRMYGFALPNTGPIQRWQLGSWRGGQWPAKVGYYQSRRVHARSNKEPYGVWLSKAFDFKDFGVTDPLRADDGIRNLILSSQLASIAWLAESDKLTIGTLSGMRQLQNPNKNEGFGATNQDQQLEAFDGAMEGVRPVNIGSVLLFADYYKQAIREFSYEINQDGYQAPDISVLSRHLLKTGIVDMAYQKAPDSVMWIVTTAGHLVAMTYEREQKILGFTKVTVAGGDPGTTAVVESVCCIPSSMRTEVYITVKRTIGGATKRFIEILSTEFEEDDDVATCVFLDSSLQYDGAAVGTVSGMMHLAGLTVNVLADRVVYKNLTVSAAGKVTLPGGVTAAKWTIGLPYVSTLRTLPIAALGVDGVKIGRRLSANHVFVDCLSTLGLKCSGIRQKRATTQPAYYDVFKRDVEYDANPNYMEPRTGVFPLKFDASNMDRGQFEVFTDDPLPAMIRAFVIGNDGDP